MPSDTDSNSDKDRANINMISKNCKILYPNQTFRDPLSQCEDRSIKRTPTSQPRTKEHNSEKVNSYLGRTPINKSPQIGMSGASAISPAVPSTIQAPQNQGSKTTSKLPDADANCVEDQTQTNTASKNRKTFNPNQKREDPQNSSENKIVKREPIRQISQRGEQNTKEDKCKRVQLSNNKTAKMSMSDSSPVSPPAGPKGSQASQSQGLTSVSTSMPSDTDSNCDEDQPKINIVSKNVKIFNTNQKWRDPGNSSENKSVKRESIRQISQRGEQITKEDKCKRVQLSNNKSPQKGFSDHSTASPPARPKSRQASQSHGCMSVSTSMPSDTDSNCDEDQAKNNIESKNVKTFNPNQQWRDLKNACENKKVKREPIRQISQRGEQNTREDKGKKVHLSNNKSPKMSMSDSSPFCPPAGHKGSHASQSQGFISVSTSMQSDTDSNWDEYQAKNCIESKNVKTFNPNQKWRDPPNSCENKKVKREPIRQISQKGEKIMREEKFNKLQMSNNTSLQIGISTGPKTKRTPHNRAYKSAILSMPTDTDSNSEIDQARTSMASKNARTFNSNHKCQDSSYSCENRCYKREPICQIIQRAQNARQERYGKVQLSNNKLHLKGMPVSPAVLKAKQSSQNRVCKSEIASIKTDTDSNWRDPSYLFDNKKIRRESISQLKREDPNKEKYNKVRLLTNQSHQIVMSDLSPVSLLVPIAGNPNHQNQRYKSVTPKTDSQFEYLELTVTAQALPSPKLESTHSQNTNNLHLRRIQPNVDQSYLKSEQEQGKYKRETKPKPPTKSTAILEMKRCPSSKLEEVVKVENFAETYKSPPKIESNNSSLNKYDSATECTSSNVNDVPDGKKVSTDQIIEIWKERVCKAIKALSNDTFNEVKNNSIADKDKRDIKSPKYEVQVCQMGKNSVNNTEEVVHNVSYSSNYFSFIDPHDQITIISLVVLLLVLLMALLHACVGNGQ